VQRNSARIAVSRDQDRRAPYSPAEAAAASIHSACQIKHRFLA
jgi:hypothetical protein